MLRPSRRAAVILASFALAFASVAPSAHADRSGSDDTDEQGGGLLDLIDVTNLLGGLGLPALNGLGLPALNGLGLPALDGLGLGGILPTGGGIGGFTTPLSVSDPLGALDGLSGPGLNLNVLVEVTLSGAVNQL